MDNNTITKALNEIVEAYGVGILQDVHRANALLKDFLPQYEKERKLILLALEEGIGADLQAVVQRDRTEQVRMITKWERRLVTDHWITEDAAQLVVSQLTGALGIASRDSPRLESGTAEEGLLPGEVELIKGMHQESEKPETYLHRYRIIGYKAFSSNTKLETVDISDSIVQIRSKAFFNCVKLKKVVIPSSVKQIGRRVFFGCKALEEISAPGGSTYCCKEGLLIKSAEQELLRATTQSQNAVVRIPDGIQMIQEFAFDGSTAKRVILPRNLKVLERNAFYRCDRLDSYEISSSNSDFRTFDGVLHTRDGKELLLYPAGATRTSYILEDSVCEIARSAFEGTKSLESITFPSSLVQIGEKAFADCRALSSLILPTSVLNIGERAFQGCSGLRNIMLPRGIREIGDYAFNGCGSLDTVSIPRSVTRIGNCAFRGCSKLRRVVIQEQVSFVGDGAFDDCSDELEITIRNNPHLETYFRMRGIKFSKK